MKFTLNWLSCKKSIGINKLKKAKAKAKKYVEGIHFTLIPVPTVCVYIYIISMFSRRLGIYAGLGDPELDCALGRWWQIDSCSLQSQK